MAHCCNSDDMCMPAHRCGADAGRNGVQDDTHKCCVRDSGTVHEHADRFCVVRSSKDKNAYPRDRGIASEIMIYTELVNKAIDIAYAAHHGQKDKAGRPYFVHVMHVAEQMDDEYSTCAALLHDTLEDTDVKAEELERIFPREVMDAVKLLTHEHGEYMDYVREVKKNTIARKVKAVDLEHNLDEARFAGCSDKLKVAAGRRREKYLDALEILRRSEDS